MIFIICIVVGIIGVFGILWISSGSLNYLENQVPKGSEWYSIHPEHLESRFGWKVQEYTRNILKIFLIWLIAIYRRISKEVTIKQVVKKKVREFLYDHTPNGVRHPSEFWHRVRHTAPTKNEPQMVSQPEKPKRVRKPKAPRSEPVTLSEISPSELESGIAPDEPSLDIDYKG